MRYIDADLLRKNMAELQEHEHKYLLTHEVFNTIWDAPTADVVEVVRCKYCKYHDDCSRNVALLGGYEMYGDIEYCSYGERSEDGRTNDIS